MGLSVAAKGMKDTYDCGYITFFNFRKELVKAAYGEKMAHIYEEMSKLYNTDCSEEDILYWNTHCNDDLDIFLFHSDCDGKFTPKECRQIYNAIKDLKMDLTGHNYSDVKIKDGKTIVTYYNMLERWKSMFEYCYKRRVNMYFC